jgi:hypothetical protein
LLQVQQLHHGASLTRIRWRNCLRHWQARCSYATRRMPFSRIHVTASCTASREV